MGHVTFESYVRRAAHLGRRSVLGMLGSGILATVGSPLDIEARRKRKKKKRNQTCRQQAAECRALVRNFCLGFPGEEAQCVTEIDPCCDFVARCQENLFSICCEDAGYCD